MEKKSMTPDEREALIARRTSVTSYQEDLGSFGTFFVITLGLAVWTVVLLICVWISLSLLEEVIALWGGIF